ncbi:subtilisin-like protease SBT3.9 isoform X1 [Primulina huaijiensis]|uniref:subtilisin-like protease SBT3.9 isoform X1 n=2 Tax=Primulina huaijiensis TaxID=1492673 RepID=UPI003CC70ECC
MNMAFHWVCVVLFFVTYQLCCFAAEGAVSSNVHIVYMGDRQQDEPHLVENSHHELLSGILESKEAASESILYSYKHGFSGFAAVLSPSQAKTIAGLPGVVSVIPNSILHLHTTRSWDFLHVNHLNGGILVKSRSGSGSIIGVLDSGIWPESESFKDDEMEPVPSRWKGKCQVGEEFDNSKCNGKIIGARWYVKGYKAELGELITENGTEFMSPRDASGHGTHTSSIAAGSLVKNVSFLGLGHGMARGGAPSARLAMYKVCWATGGCSSADLLAALDDAIHDGVDVISMSLGLMPPLSSYFNDVVSVGSFHAVASGIPVICSGGNSGPFPETVVNTAPWMITVAASTIDRAFPVALTIGNNQTFVGQSLFISKDLDKFYPIVYGEDIAATGADEDDARSCASGSLNATLAKGKVILCFESRSQRFVSTAESSVHEVEGVGIVFARFLTKDVSLCLEVPCAQVDFTIGTSILSYIASTRNPVIKYNAPKTAVGQQVSPNVALFSSRGPSSLSPSVLKPDIAAPGVNILASWSAAQAAQPYDDIKKNKLSPFHFKFESGTSMACPHVTAIVALIKTIHPKWSPAAIKSALITTALSTDEYGQPAVAEGSPYKQADPFDYGGGHIDPNKAIDPGLIFDTDTGDYTRFLCAMGYNASSITPFTRTKTACPKTTSFLANFNLPSVTIPELKRGVTVSRTVTNVGSVSSVYVARIKAPPGTHVIVEPGILKFCSTVKKIKFKVTFWSNLSVQGVYSFGSLVWDDGFHHVRIPLIVRSVLEEY